MPDAATTPVRVNTHLVDYRRDTYADVDHDPRSGTRDLVDCALGTNPYGAPPVAVTVTAGSATIATYPGPDPAFRDAIAAYWAEVAPLERRHVQLESGAFGIIERLNKLLLQPGSRVLGYCPQFPDFAHDVVQRGAVFDHVALQPGRDLRFRATDLVEGLRPHHRLVYLDNPNNPTGQVIPLGEVEAVVAAAAELGVTVLVDEAYGDFMARDASAIGLVPRYENLVVGRSFSKGWGLAGLRVGYGVMSAAMLPLWEKVSHPFPVNAPGQELARRSLGATAFLDSCTRRVRADKARVLRACRRMIVPGTADTVPIFTLIHPDQGVDLREELLSRHVLTSSGSHFTGLGRNAARIRIPREADDLIDALRDIEATTL